MRGGLRSAYDHIGHHKPYILELIRQGGAFRWMSPELFDPEKFGLKDSRRTKRSDCYALGMVIYEVLSRRVPFHQHADFAVVVRVGKGERPGRPQGGEGV